MNHEVLKAIKGKQYYEMLVSKGSESDVRFNGRTLTQHRDWNVQDSGDYSCSFSLGGTVGILSMTVLPIPKLYSQRTQKVINSTRSIELSVTGCDSYHQSFMNQILNENYSVNTRNLNQLFKTINSESNLSNINIEYGLKLVLVAHIVTDDGTLANSKFSNFHSCLFLLKLRIFL